MPRHRGRLLAAILGVVTIVGVAGFAAVARPWETRPACPAVADNPSWSVARRWDEALLDAIRRALPNPPVHARNLFHLSTAMWDAWATYDPTADGYLVTEKHTAGDTAAAPQRGDQLRRVPGAVRAVHQRRRRRGIAVRVRERDGQPLLPARRDRRPTATRPRRSATGSRRRCSRPGSTTAPTRPTATPPRTTSRSTRRSSSTSPATTMTDPNRWQPLQLEHMISQNGIPIENGVQQAVGPHWGQVASFALPRRRRERRADRSGSPAAARRPASDQAYKDAAVEVIRDSSELDAASDETIDISPGRPRRQLARHERRAGPRGQPGDRPAVSRRTSSTAATSPAPSPSSGPTDPSRRRRRATGTWSPTRSPTSWTRTCGSAAPASRSTASSGTSSSTSRSTAAVHDAAIAAWGLKGALRLGPADLDDPLPGRDSGSRATPASRRTTPKACRWCRT